MSVQQRAGAGGGQGGEDRQAEGSAELLPGGQESGGETGLVFVDAGVGRRGQIGEDLDGIRFLSVRRSALAVIEGLDDRRLATLDVSLGAGTGTAGAAVALVGFTALAIRRLTKMDVP
jgi:hypothetical protein